MVTVFPENILGLKDIIDYHFNMFKEHLPVLDHNVEYYENCRSEEACRRSWPATGLTHPPHPPPPPTPTKCLPFRRRHFQMHFREWKVLYFD